MLGRSARATAAAAFARAVRGACLLATLSAAWGAAEPTADQDEHHAEATEWVNTEGVGIVASFVRLGDEGLVIRKDGRDFVVPLYKLSPESRARARELAEKAPVVPPTEGPASVEAEPGFGKQSDPDHERKLAVAVVSKGGLVAVWQGDGWKDVRRIDELPKGRIRLKFIETKGGTFGDQEAALLNGCRELTELRLWGSGCRALPLESLPNLEILRISGDVPASIFPTLPRLKKLTMCVVSDSTIPLGDESIRWLGECDALKYVELVSAGLSSTSLAPLARLEALGTLLIGGNRFDSAALAPLAEADGVERLGLHNTNLSRVDLAFLAEMDSLRGLGLDDATLSRDGVASIAACRDLRALDLTRAKVTEEMLTPLAGHRGLREIHLLGSDVCGRAILSGEPLPALRTLVLGNDPVTDADLEKLALACPHLEKLIVRGKGLTSAGYPHLASLRALRELEIAGGTELSAEALEIMAALPQLQWLRLWRCDVDDAALPGLEKARRSLLELDLRGTQVTDASLEFLAGCKLLDRLLISGARVSEEGIKTLKAELKGCRVE